MEPEQANEQQAPASVDEAIKSMSRYTVPDTDEYDGAIAEQLVFVRLALARDLDPAEHVAAGLALVKARAGD